MNLSSEECIALVAKKANQLRTELEALAVEISVFYRTPGSAKAPVAYQLIGETRADVEEARADKRLCK